MKVFYKKPPLTSLNQKRMVVHLTLNVWILWATEREHGEGSGESAGHTDASYVFPAAKRS